MNEPSEAAWARFGELAVIAEEALKAQLVQELPQAA